MEKGKKMPMRHNRQPQLQRSVLVRSQRVRQPGARRRLWTRSIALLLPLALVLVAFLAPTGQARPASERSPQEEALAVSTKAAKAAERKLPEWPNEEAAEWENGVGEGGGEVVITCTQVSWTFRNFPDAPKNVVTELLTVNGNVVGASFVSFDGPTGSHTTAIDEPPGRYTISAEAKWKTNGLKGHFHIAAKLECPPTPAFSIEKLQEIAGGGSSYTTAPLIGLLGQTVAYEILVQNTGNVPLTLAALNDPYCDAGTLSGGPGGGGTLAPQASASYLCTHLVSAADQSAGSLSDTATLTGTPPAGEGSPVTQTSNTLLVKVPRPVFSIEARQQIAGASGLYTAAPLSALSGQTVDYEIFVQNTGNVPLTLAALNDPYCDPGTLSGGPGGSGVLPPGGAASYLCTHLLDLADQSAGSYSDTATLTGTPPAGEGSPVTLTSNTLLVSVPAPPPAPASSFSIETLQQVVGAGGGGSSYTAAPLSGQVGQIVWYEIVVANTGDVPLTLAALNDPGCDPGTLSGGPGGGTLPAGAFASYLCTHLLSAGDESAGSYSNTATLTGTPPAGEGSPLTHTSNTVLVTLAPSPTLAPAGAPPAAKGVLAAKEVKPTKAQMLTKALKACKKDKRHAKRKKCEKAARAKYGPVHKKAVHKK